MISQAHTTNLNIVSMLAAWRNISSHTQTVFKKQPKPRKETFPQAASLVCKFWVPHSRKEIVRSSTTT